MLLVGRLRVAVARGEHHALHAQVHHFPEELSHPHGRGAVEHGRVGGHPEAVTNRLSDRRHRFVVDTLPTYRVVMLFAQPIHVDAEAEVLRRREQPPLQLLFEEDGIGAEVDVLLALDQLLDQAANIRIHQRLAAGDGYHRRPAFVHGAQALLEGQLPLQDMGGVLDLAASGAGQIAAEKGLEHEHERIALAPSQLLAEHVGADRPHLGQGDTHTSCRSFLRGRAAGALRVDSPLASPPQPPRG